MEILLRALTISLSLSSSFALTLNRELHLHPMCSFNKHSFVAVVMHTCLRKHNWILWN